MSLRLTLPGLVLANPHKRAAAFGWHQANLRAKAARAQAGGFDFPTQLIGTTPNGKVTLYYDPSLGQPGLDLAQQIFARVAQTYSDTQAFYNIPGQPVNVIIAAVNGATDGSGGAYHYGCDFTSGGDLYCDAAFGNPDLTNGLVIAELTESFMGAQNIGWNCGGSNGEALSRFHAELLSGGANGSLASYASGPAWDQAGRPDWIDATEPTDQNYVSTGCGMIYLYWMMFLGYTAAQITQAGCPDGTLASNYQALTGKPTAWADFSAALNGLAGGISSDNPWDSPNRIRALGPATSGSEGHVLVHPGTRTVTIPPGWKTVASGGTSDGCGCG